MSRDLDRGEYQIQPRSGLDRRPTDRGDQRRAQPPRAPLPPSATRQARTERGAQRARQAERAAIGGGLPQRPAARQGARRETRNDRASGARERTPTPPLKYTALGAQARRGRGGPRGGGGEPPRVFPTKSAHRSPYPCRAHHRRGRRSEARARGSTARRRTAPRLPPPPACGAASLAARAPPSCSAIQIPFSLSTRLCGLFTRLCGCGRVGRLCWRVHHPAPFGCGGVSPPQPPAAASRSSSGNARPSAPSKAAASLRLWGSL